mgnify:CR=1 FL=1
MTTSSTPQRPLGDRVSSVANWSIGLLVAHGAIGLIFGILVLSSPSKATNVITPFVGYLIAFWLIDTGATEIAAVARLRRDFPGWGWDMFFGVLTLIAGIVLLFVPVGTGFFVALLALWLHPRLPPAQLSKETTDVVRLGVGAITTITTVTTIATTVESTT